MEKRFLYAQVMIAGVLCALASGCGKNPVSAQGGGTTLYLESFLRAGNPVDSVFVGVPTPVSETIGRDSSGVIGAAVTLSVDGTTFTLRALPGRPGYYTLPTLRVASGKTYLLTVKAGGNTAQATTTVPPPPTVSASITQMKVGDSPITVTWSSASDKNGFLSVVAAQSLGDVIPIETLFGGGFGRFPGFGGADTTGFTAARDSLSIRDRWQFPQGHSATLNWRQFSRYGTYAFRVYALDANYADYLVSSQQNAQTLDEPRFHVTGGIGIFASMSADSVVFQVSQ